MSRDNEVLSRKVKKRKQGFGYFELCIADMASINETFFWWHGITADEGINEGQY